MEAALALDADGDGHLARGAMLPAFCEDLTLEEATAGAPVDDCDDQDESVWPGADERCGDGVVNDCDGQFEGAQELCDLEGEFDLASADAKLMGEAAYDLAGWSVSGVGDVNGDGRPDLLIGAPFEFSDGVGAGAAYLVLGTSNIGRSLSEADAKIIGEVDLDRVGWSVSGAGDVDGDGLADLLIGAPGEDAGATGAGAAFLESGPVGDSHSFAVFDAKLTGEAEGDEGGVSVSGAGDVDGDGLADLLVGAPEEDGGGADAGAAYLAQGPVSDIRSLETADAKLTGTDSYGEAGSSVAGVGDVDGDGLADLLIGAPGEVGGGASSGAAHLVLGPVSGVLSLLDADAELSGEWFYDEAGASVSGAGDVNRDGLADLLIGAAKAETGGTDAGAAYLVLGPVSGTRSLSDADARFTGERTYDEAGFSVSDAGDVDGDGLADLLIGAPHDDTGNSLAGVAYLVLAPVTGACSLSESDARLTGWEESSYAGWSVSGAGDVDGNGMADLLIGAPFEDSEDEDGGAAYLIIGVY